MPDQNVIAVLYDCDKTLTPEYMQEPIFRAYRVNGQEFWDEKALLVRQVKDRGGRIAEELAYLNQILRYVRRGTFPGLSNARLRELGADLKFFPGVPECFNRLREVVKKNPHYQKQDITVEQYVVSTGLTEIMRGSGLNDYLTDIFGCEFLEDENGIIAEVAQTITFTEKTRFIFEIQKGCNVDPSITVNSKVPEELRRVPLHQMVYVGDGPSDIPCFSVINGGGGYSLAVYDPQSDNAFRQAFALQQDRRVFAIGPADYQPGSHTSKLLEQIVTTIADGMVHQAEEEKRVHSARIRAPPRHT